MSGRWLPTVLTGSAAGRDTVAAPDEVLARLGVDTGSAEGLLATLPFLRDDATGGAEAELQAAVAGDAWAVDLPARLRRSSHFEQVARRAATGDVSPRLAEGLLGYVADNDAGIWENSWVCLPRQSLNGLAEAVLQRDLLADKQRPELGLRSDVHRFVAAGTQGEELRIPVSYLLKLALADAVGRPDLAGPVRATGQELLEHFLNDNTSPETFSFFVVPLSPGRGLGRALGREAAQRFLLSHLLVQYANRQFHLADGGQRAMIYAAPQPPWRQRRLNSLIPDALYRELFMSPCLSGWDRGEEKHQYMHLCHRVLSRSHLNAVAKLRDAGIIVNNLVVLPDTSNTSLANNGVHISLGSRLLGAARRDPGSGFGAAEEKHLGDLAIKIMEHFLPLFVGTYSAAPWRLGFGDFHPEQALGFLSHELDFSHLRMLWRRWRQKARLTVLGRSVTPFGPPWLDRLVARVLGLQGDFVPDYRLVDYPVALLSTERCPALDGRLGNQQRLKEDLAGLGIIDARMALYLPVRQREFDAMGFCGFEGRQYSLFPEFEGDMGAAASLQQLITALVYKYLALGQLDHRHLPDQPEAESERRQMFFAAALDLPEFFVRQNSRNILLHRILARTVGVRPSRRYAGWLRVPAAAYRLALLHTLQADGADLVEALGLQETLQDLRRRLELPGPFAASGRLTGAILEELGAAEPLAVPAEEFNQAAERVYREALRRSQLAEGLELLATDLAHLECLAARDGKLRQALHELLGAGSAVQWLRALRGDCLEERLPAEVLRKIIHLVLLNVHVQSGREYQNPTTAGVKNVHAASVY